MSCPVCIDPLEAQPSFAWQCLHQVHVRCMFEGRMDNNPCPMCRYPWDASDSERLGEIVRANRLNPRMIANHYDASVRRADRDRPPDNGDFDVPLPLPDITVLCHNRCDILRGEFVTTTDSRMMWSPKKTADGDWLALWLCGVCGSECVESDLTDAVAVEPCRVHGGRVLVADRLNQLLYWSCADPADESESPLPYSCMFTPIVQLPWPVQVIKDDPVGNVINIDEAMPEEVMPEEAMPDQVMPDDANMDNGTPQEDAQDRWWRDEYGINLEDWAAPWAVSRALQEPEPERGVASTQPVEDSDDDAPLASLVAQANLEPAETPVPQAPAAEAEPEPEVPQVEPLARGAALPPLSESDDESMFVLKCISDGTWDDVLALRNIVMDCS